jgi:hypothetical protein
VAISVIQDLPSAVSVARWRFSKPNLGELAFLEAVLHFYFCSGVFFVLICFWRFFWRF